MSPLSFDRYDLMLEGISPEAGAPGTSEYDPTPEGEYSGLFETSGPCSNTGQNARLIKARREARTKPRANIPRSGSPGDGALIDYLTLTVAGADELVREVGSGDFPQKFLRMVVGGDCPLTASEWLGSGFQGYANSAAIINAQGEYVGRIAMGGNNDTILFHLPGEGCEAINDWHRVQHACLTLGAKLTRVDLAWDDLKGDLFNPRRLHEQVREGQLRIRTQGPGQPPKTRFLDDHGNDTGCTLYAGKKGHKELCIYEKGKQLGDFSSPWVRCEARFWSKRSMLPVTMLTQPLAFLRAAYNVCEVIPANCAQRVETIKAKVQVSAMAWARWLNVQMGASVRLLHRVMGPENAAEYLFNVLARNGVPGRFKTFSEAHLTQFISEGLHVGRCNQVGALA